VFWKILNTSFSKNADAFLFSSLLISRQHDAKEDGRTNSDAQNPGPLHHTLRRSILVCGVLGVGKEWRRVRAQCERSFIQSIPSFIQSIQHNSSVLLRWLLVSRYCTCIMDLEYFGTHLQPTNQPTNHPSIIHPSIQPTIALLALTQQY